MLDNVLHSQSEGDIHFNLYVPDGYDAAREVALFVTLPFHRESSSLEMLHMLAAYWGFVLASVHLGMNLRRAVSKLRKRLESSAIALWVARAAIAAVACYGAFAFASRGFYRCLFGLNHFAFFDAVEPLAPYVLDYLAIAVLFAVVGHAMANAIARLRARR